MPRTARASRGGYCYHVINRGNGRAEVFHKDADYQPFVRLIGDACARLPMRVLGYCLMPKHPLTWSLPASRSNPNNLIENTARTA